MNVLAFVSRKGGAGKSTLAAHLAVHVHRSMRPCLLIDDDPQGSLTLWNELRAESALPLKIVKRDIAHIVKKAKRNGVEWVFIDTPPNTISGSLSRENTFDGRLRSVASLAIFVASLPARTGLAPRFFASRAIKSPV